MPATLTDKRGASFDVPLAALAFLALLAIPTLIFNPVLFRLLNDLHSPLTDGIWLSLTTLGDGLVLGIFAGAFLVKNPRIAVLAVLLLLGETLVVHIIKPVLDTPRPAAVLESVHVVGPLLRSTSFPSGHTAAAMSIALAVAHYSRSWIGAVASILFAALVGLSRIFVGAHFPLDVLGGAACSLAVFQIVKMFVWPSLEGRIPDHPRFSSRRFQVSLGLEALLALYTLAFFGPRFAEIPLVAELAGAGVLVVLAVAWGRQWAAAG